MKEIFSKKQPNSGKYYGNSTQAWLPIEDIRGGVVLLKDGRYIKILEVLPVNFYLKSSVEQENIIFYFASYLKIAPDNMQIRVMTQRADISDYLTRLDRLAEGEYNDQCRSMIYDEMEFVRGLSENVAVKKRFFIVFEYTPKLAYDGHKEDFSDIKKGLADEAYKAQRYLSRCGLEVLNINDDGFLIDLIYGIINKRTSRYVAPGNFADGMLDEIHTYEGGRRDE